MRQLPFFIAILCLISSCNTVDRSPFEYVDVFIGTGGHGHTHPAATLPFGMMQLGPDTRLDGWDGCSGYHYSDNRIYGFSHTHLSGTGVGDYNDLLIMPSTSLILNDKETLASVFSKSNEPNFLKFGIQASLKRMFKPFFDFCKIWPSRAKKRAILAVFWPFLQSFELRYFSSP